MCIIYKAVKLTQRGLLHISGADSFAYIQCLITNDLRSKQNCIYASFLNAVSKVLVDFLIYKYSGNPSERQLLLSGLTKERYGIDGQMNDGLLLECDKKLLEPAYKTFFAHKLRKKVIVEIAPEYNIWSIYPDVNYEQTDARVLPLFNEIKSQDVMFFQDPRIRNFGYRFLTRLGGNTFENVKHYLSYVINSPLVLSTLQDYHKYRYKLGLAEGLIDMKPCFINATDVSIDFMGGLSFVKGHFLGSQPILRRQLRNTIRTRMMPLEFILPEGKNEDYLNTLNLAWGTNFEINSKQCAMMISRKGKYGIAIVDINKIMNTNFQMYHKQAKVFARTWIPPWWPKTLYDIRNKRYKNSIDYICNM